MSQRASRFSCLSVVLAMSACGCADYSLKGNADELAEFDSSDSLTVPAPPSLRLDVLPPYNQTDGALLSESFTVQAGVVDLRDGTFGQPTDAAEFGAGEVEHAVRHSPCASG